MAQQTRPRRAAGLTAQSAGPELRTGTYIGFPDRCYDRQKGLAARSETHEYLLVYHILMKNKRLTIALAVFGLLAGCAEEAPPRSVTEFRENPILLEATIVLCAQNRSTMKYEVECVNAREAINLMARDEAEANREDLEAQSERKRRALRRAQEAAAESRRRAAEAERLRREAEYLGQFESLPVELAVEGSPVMPAEEQPLLVPEEKNQPAAEEAVPGAGSDLDAIRKELERRNN